MVADGAVALNPSMACSYALMPEDLRIAMSMAMASDWHKANRQSRHANAGTSLEARQRPAMRVMRLIANRPAMYTPPASVLSRLVGTGVPKGDRAANHAQHMHGVPLTVSNDLTAPDKPTIRSIRAHRPMLKHDV